MEATGVEAFDGDVEQYEITEDEEDKEEKLQPKLGLMKRVTSKRKRSLAQNDEEEIARRRRRRRSLTYQQRRRSLTPGEKKAATVAGTVGTSVNPARSKQYISDMYSTIIKMSSENKINVKNSWSLHLIDHMEDILDSSTRMATDGGDVDDDTYNFQKASCTLDASIKIYSYRVDDTWNSSYKILENLSRTEQKHGADEKNGESTAIARKTRKSHVRTIEKNLNNINLKVYDTECEADPLFHKMSQSFDEGGAKGMLLANLSVYDGCKILLNSSDVSVVTRKPMHDLATKSRKIVENQAKERTGVTDDVENRDQARIEDGDTVATTDEDQIKKGFIEKAVIENDGKKGDLLEDKTLEKDLGAKRIENVPKGTIDRNEDRSAAANERISLSVFGNLSCISQDVQDMEVCPPLIRMYDQLDELYGDEARHRLGLQNEFLLKTPVKGHRQTLNKRDAVTKNLAAIMEGARDEESAQEEAQHDIFVDVSDNIAEYDADKDGSDPIEDDDEVVELEPPAEDVDMEKEKKVIDLAESDNDDSVEKDGTMDGTEPSVNALDKESSLTSSAADFFRAKVNENMPENSENHLFSQMIESALFQSEDEKSGDNQSGKQDYSYFDVKLFRNWAGPGYWKFPAVHKFQIKQRVKQEADNVGLEGDDESLVIKAEQSNLSMDRSRKGNSSSGDKKAAVMVDFFSGAPDLSRLQAPKSALSLEVSKGILRKQMENAPDLVLPVDSHIELGLFFRHFLKDKTRFFRKRGGSPDGARREGVKTEILEVRDSSGDGQDQELPFFYNQDDGGFDDDEDEGSTGADRAGAEAMYSVEGLVQADRVVEKIGVQYERFAKRVDVKKLKGSIWDHLEKKIVQSGGNKTEGGGQCGSADTMSASGKRPRERVLGDEDDEFLGTNFESVVENVAGKVPSNVTVSFYFICMLHLANEKGLELVGQDNLCNFQISKE